MSPTASDTRAPLSLPRTIGISSGAPRATTVEGRLRSDRMRLDRRRRSARLSEFRCEIRSNERRGRCHPRTDPPQTSCRSLGRHVVNYVVREARAGEAAYAADLHRPLYGEENAWGEGFTSYAEKIALDFEAKPKSARKAFFVAQAVVREDPSGAKLVGCIMLCGTPDPEVGRRLIETLLEKARAADYRKLVLLTAAPLEAALRQCERFGFRISARSENHDWRVDGGAVVKIKMERSFERPRAGRGGRGASTPEFRAAGAKRLESSGCADCRSPSVLIQVT